MSGHHELFSQAATGQLREEPGFSNALAYDGNGKLYVLGSDGKLKRADVRQQLLSGDWAKIEAQSEGGSGSSSSAALSVRQLAPNPAVDFVVTRLSISRDGSYAALSGHETEDPDIGAIAVVSLALGPPTASNSGEQACECTRVDAELFSSRPGLRILQVSWHPGSEAHLAVLTSDNTWRLYSVHDLSLPEQRFELQLKGRRSLGLGGGQGRQAVAFAFGAAHAWERYTVYFVCSDGSIFALCPVAAFGSACPTSVAEQLVASCSQSEDIAHSLTTEAWLQQVFPSPLPAPRHNGERPASARASVVTVRPHALEEHAPALVGPLPIQAPDGDVASVLELVGEEDEDPIVGLTALRYGNVCSALVASTCTGWLSAMLLADDICPRWAEAPPQQITQGDATVATRCQVEVQSEAAPPLLNLDAVNLQLRPTPAAVEAAADGFANLAMLADPSAAERLYCCHSKGAFAVTLSWLPILAAHLQQEAPGTLPELPPPIVEELRAMVDDAVGGAAAVGDWLTGTGLVLLEADGQARCLWPSRFSSGDQARRQAQTSSGGPASTSHAADIEAKLNAEYGELLRGPRNISLPKASGPLSADSPEGQRYLNDSIKVLREKHVEFIHLAHRVLSERVADLKSEADSLQERHDALQGPLEAVGEQRQRLDARLQRSSDFHDNLAARLKLLAELHWSLPRPLTLAEQRLKEEELPDWSRTVQQLQKDLKGLRVRTAAFKTRSLPAPTAHAKAFAIPATQLRQVRQAIAEHAQLIASSMDRLSLLESRLPESEADAF
ncbi:hypothetical protein WJX72_000600 [[Myrmecia] bisecta]|uniref:Uncharacterized protein n=1 Tax=[Myrmecia] bisecta TaxID=41462 RepID=A0AAW1Q8D6_9CHLO